MKLPMPTAANCLRRVRSLTAATVALSAKLGDPLNKAYPVGFHPELSRLGA
jgi:hypothetical protein